MSATTQKTVAKDYASHVVELTLQAYLYRNFGPGILLLFLVWIVGQKAAGSVVL